MKRFASCLAAAVAFGTASVATEAASLGTLPGSPPGFPVGYASFDPTANFVVAQSFTLNQAIVLSSVAVYLHGNGASEPQGLFKFEVTDQIGAAATASNVRFTGTAPFPTTLANEVKPVNFSTPLTLDAGTYYIVLSSAQGQACGWANLGDILPSTLGEVGDGFIGFGANSGVGDYRSVNQSGTNESHANFLVTAVPEPTTLMLLPAGAGLLSRRQRRGTIRSLARRPARARSLVAALGSTALIGTAAHATTWTPLDYPGADSTYAYGIDGPNVVGEYYTPTAGPFGMNHAGGTFVPHQYPASVWTQVRDVDGALRVGSYWDGTKIHAFRRDGANWQSIDFPGTNQTFAHGVEGTRTVGSYGTLGAGHGFLLDGTTFTTLDYPGATDTRIKGISGSRMVGRYAINGSFFAFVRNGGAWSTLAFPGADFTNANGVEGATIVGSYFKDDAFHGYFYDGTTWTTLDYPGALYTEVYGVDGLNVVGIYTEASGAQHGFLAVVPEPATAATLAATATLLLVSRRRSR